MWFSLYVCVSIPIAFYKDTSHIGLGHIYMTSPHFTLITSLKALSAKYSHILQYYVLGIQHMNFKKKTIQSITHL